MSGLFLRFSNAASPQLGVPTKAATLFPALICLRGTLALALLWALPVAAAEGTDRNQQVGVAAAVENRDHKPPRKTRRDKERSKAERRSGETDPTPFPRKPQDPGVSRPIPPPPIREPYIPPLDKETPPKKSKGAGAKPN